MSMESISGASMLPLTASTSANKTSEALSVGTSVLKTAIDSQAEAAATLIESIGQTPTVEAVNLPSNLGNFINTKA